MGVSVVSLAAAAALVAMTLSLLAAPAEAQRASDVIGGNTAGLSGTLLKGCHRYHYAHVLQLPTDDWSLEVSIVDRRGDAVASSGSVVARRCPAPFGSARP